MDILDKQGARERAAPQGCDGPKAAPLGKGNAKAKAKAKAKPETEAELSAGADVHGLLGAAATAADTLFHIDMLPARHGDALWLEYGPRDAAVPHRMLIDCGPAGTYPLLKKRIEALPREQRHFELFILTHIDDDHIGAAIKLLKDAKTLGLSFGDIWFNGWRHISDLMNARQGEEFSRLLEANGLPWNQAKGGARMVREEDELPRFTLPSGMVLTLLSPTPERLAALARSWDKEMTRRAAEAKAKAEPEPDRGDELMADVPDGGWSDDVPALAAERFDSDNTAPNGSSIAVLAEYGGRRVLLGADAYAPVLQQAVELMQQQDPTLKPLPLSAFKLPHHGSRNNLSSELLALLRCEHYLVSTDGPRFNHPDRQAIARVIEHGRASGLPATLWFNYRTLEPLNGVWDREDLKARYGYRTVYPADGEPVLRFSPA
jgi:beta-lactamase superfamily II metal-dependent hydrolase